MNCPVCGGEKFTPTSLGVDFCDECMDRDAEVRAAREDRVDARNMDGEIRQVIDDLHAKLFTGQATLTTFEDAVIAALNAERRLILRRWLDAEASDEMIYTVSSRLGKEK